MTVQIPVSIILSAGGTHFLYHLAFLDELFKSKFWVEHFKIRNASGVSAGALAGVIASLGQTEQMIQKLQKCAGTDIFTRWPGQDKLLPRAFTSLGKIIRHPLCGANMLMKGAVFESESFGGQTVADFYNQTTKTFQFPVFVTVANQNSGLTEAYDNTAPQFLEYLTASASIPFLVKPVSINGNNYVDGGTYQSLPLQAHNMAVSMMSETDRAFFVTLALCDYGNNPASSSASSFRKAFFKNKWVNVLINIVDTTLVGGSHTLSSDYYLSACNLFQYRSGSLPRQSQYFDLYMDPVAITMDCEKGRLDAKHFISVCKAKYDIWQRMVRQI